jgi:hypothetical protein
MSCLPAWVGLEQFVPDRDSLIGLTLAKQQGAQALKYGAVLEVVSALRFHVPVAARVTL